MKARFWVPIALVITITFVAACNPKAKPARTDPQVASDVQARIASDPTVQSKQITVQASNGTVTLSGTANTEAEKVAASNDAGAVDGVTKVLNNLTVQPADAQTATQPAPVTPALAPAAVAEQKPAPELVKAAPRKSSAAIAHKVSSADTVEQGYNEPAPAAASQPAAAPVAAAAPAPPAAPPAAPAKITIPEGTAFSIRLIDALDSEHSQEGDVFRATLNAPITVNDAIVVPEGADIEGRVDAVHSAGKFAGKSLLTVELTKLAYNGHDYTLVTSQWTKEGSSRGKNTAAKVGAGAAIGAILGGIAGGGKGAAIGSAAGAGVGGGVQATTKAQQIKLTSESVLSFKLESPITVTPASAVNRNSNRQSMN